MRHGVFGHVKKILCALSAFDQARDDKHQAQVVDLQLMLAVTKKNLGTV